jgi:hypothetical protein
MPHRVYRVVSFEITAPYTLRVRFDDATAQVINLQPILAGEIYAPLGELSLFNQVRIDHARLAERCRLRSGNLARLAALCRGLCRTCARLGQQGRVRRSSIGKPWSLPDGARQGRNSAVSVRQR